MTLAGHACHSRLGALARLVTFVQLLYLESLRLRTRDLRSLEFFKETLEDKLGLKTEDGAGAFSLIKHTLLVLLGVFYFVWFADDEPWHAGVFWQAALAVWLTMIAVAYALPPVSVPPHHRPLARPAGAAFARSGVDRPPVRGGARVLPVAGGSDG